MVGTNEREGHAINTKILILRPDHRTRELQVPALWKPFLLFAGVFLQKLPIVFLDPPHSQLWLTDGLTEFPCMDGPCL